MVTVDSTASPVRLKRRGKGARHRQIKRKRIRQESLRLVKTGKVDLTPCVACGSEDNLGIHHLEPIQADRFVFLCEPCHLLVHKPVFRRMDVCVASGHLSIRPEAVVQPKPSVSPTDTPAPRTVTPARHTNSPARQKQPPVAHANSPARQKQPPVAHANSPRRREVRCG